MVVFEDNHQRCDTSRLTACSRYAAALARQSRLMEEERERVFALLRATATENSAAIGNAKQNVNMKHVQKSLCSCHQLVTVCSSPN